MMKRRRSLILLLKVFLILTIVCCLYPQISFATSPQDVILDYDAGTQMLTVSITHPSLFPSHHYIKYVEINKNGAEAMKNTYESQPDMDTFSYTYKLPAAEGETLEVTARCSWYGYKTVSLTVGKK